MSKKGYFNKDWMQFSAKVQKRDGYKCLKCGKSWKEVVLQTHHKIYKRGLKLWDYSLSDCITLCRGCHAQHHGIIEPQDGWELISIEDLGGMFGTCEKKGCGKDIRFEHVIYHPNWGYKVVGSTCVEVLTQEDQYLSQEILAVFKKISDFVRISEWHVAYTRKLIPYLYTKHQHHEIRIYGKPPYYSYQIGTKEKSIKSLDYGKCYNANNRTLEQAKELGFILLKGTTTQDRAEKDILRNIYKSIR